MDALVTDAEQRSAVAGIRGLGRAGIPVIAVGKGRAAAGLWSRHARRRAVLRRGYPAALIDCMKRAGTERGAVVYPAKEDTIDTLLSAKLPRGASLPYGSLEGLRRLRDKRSLTELAEEVGLAVPETLREAEAGELARGSAPLPCVVKPALPTSALSSAVVVYDRAGLQALVGKVGPHEPLLVQELVGGPLTAVAMVLSQDGEVMASFQQQAHRTWPVDAGTSSLAVSVAPDPELMTRAAELLRSAPYGGLAHMQFVGAGPARRLIDVNPRFYGSLPLAMACGVNLPAVWHASACGHPVPGPTEYRVGVTYRWLEGELLGAVRGAGRSRLAAVSRALRPSRPPRVGAVWSAQDPLASAIFAANLGREIARRRLP
jgi:predicted ATP-grasp superfamily ATP-dependent carboligase